MSLHDKVFEILMDNARSRENHGREPALRKISNGGNSMEGNWGNPLAYENNFVGFDIEGDADNNNRHRPKRGVFGSGMPNRKRKSRRPRALGGCYCGYCEGCPMNPNGNGELEHHDAEPDMNNEILNHMMLPSDASYKGGKLAMINTPHNQLGAGKSKASQDAIDDLMVVAKEQDKPQYGGKKAKRGRPKGGAMNDSFKVYNQALKALKGKGYSVKEARAMIKKAKEESGGYCGGSFWDTLGNIAKTALPFVPLLL